MIPHVSDTARHLVARYGFHLVEMPHGTKAPKRGNWPVETIHDPERAAAHWKAHEDDNIGVVLGPSRLCSLDADDLPATRELMAEFGIDVDELAQTFPTVQGNRERFRILFRVPDGLDLARHAFNWPSRDDPTKNAVIFELRAGAVQDVLPPSLHPDGMRYQWITKPKDGLIAEIPPRLLTIWQQWDVFKRNAASLCPWNRPKAAQNAPQSPPLPRDGGSVIEQWNAAHSLEATLAAYGYEQIGRRWLSPHSGTKLPGVVVLDAQRCFIHHASDPLCSDESGKPVNAFDLFAHYEHAGDIKKAVKAAAEALGLPPLPRGTTPEEPEWLGEIPEHSDEWRERYEPVSEWKPNGGHRDMLEGEPWPEPTNFMEEAPLPKLSRSCLPAALAEFVFDQSEIIGSDPCILAISTLVACASVTSDTIKLQPKQHEHGWRESARLWGAFVGDPSVKKTPPLNRATAHLRKLDMEFAETAAEHMHRFKIAKKVYDAQEKRYIDAQAKGQFSQPLPEPPERPPQRRIIVQDATIEAIADVLADNDQGILVLFDELAGFFGSMDAYRGGAGSKDRSFWLEAYNGGPRRVDRITREARHVPNLSCCILGGIQPSAIRAKAGDMVEDGLLQRFMIVCAEGGSSVGEDRRADSEAQQRYRSILDWLVKQSGDPERPVLFDDEALAVFRRVEIKLNGFVREDRLPLRMRLQLGKWSGLFARLSLTYWAIECANLGMQVAGRITADVAERVEAFLFEYLFWHLKWFYEGICGDSTSTADAARKVALWILAKQPERVTSSMLSKGVRGWRSASWKVRRDVFDLLEVCGWIMPEPARGHANRSWAVNVTCYELFRELAEQERKRREEVVDAITGTVQERREKREYE